MSPMAKRPLKRDWRRIRAVSFGNSEWTVYSDKQKHVKSLVQKGRDENSGKVYKTKSHTSLSEGQESLFRVTNTVQSQSMTGGHLQKKERILTAYTALLCTFHWFVYLLLLNCQATGEADIFMSRQLFKFKMGKLTKKCLSPIPKICQRAYRKIKFIYCLKIYIDCTKHFLLGSKDLGRNLLKSVSVN